MRVGEETDKTGCLGLGFPHMCRHVTSRCPVEQGVKGRGPGAGMALPCYHMEQNSKDSEDSQSNSGFLHYKGTFAKIEG